MLSHLLPNLGFSFALLFLVARYNRREFTFGHPRFFWPKVITEFLLATLLICGYASWAQNGLEGFFVVIGPTLATLISLLFYAPPAAFDATSASRSS